MLKRIERDLDTMRAQGRFGAAPALPAVEYVPKDDGLLNTLVRQQPVFEPQPGNATIAAKKQCHHCSQKAAEIQRHRE